MTVSHIQINIRDADYSDVEGILEIYGPFITDTWTSFEEEIPSEEDMWDRISYYADSYPWLVAEWEDEIIGYAYANAYRSRPAYRWSAEVSVYITTSWHGKNIGNLLYQELFEILTKQNIREVFAGVTLPNPKSERFHIKMGFEEIGVYRNVGFKHGNWHDVRWYQKTLNASNPPEEFIPYSELEEG